VFECLPTTQRVQKNKTMSRLNDGNHVDNLCKECENQTSAWFYAHCMQNVTVYSFEMWPKIVSYDV
jgi:hypothetical protein